MKYKKRRAMIATFLIGGTVAVIGAHLVEPNVKGTMKV